MHYTHTGNTIAIILYDEEICTFRTAATTITTCPVSVGAVLLPLLPWRRVTQDRGSRSLLITVDSIPIYSSLTERIYPVLVNIYSSPQLVSIPSTDIVESSGKFGKSSGILGSLRNVYLLYV